MDKKTESRLHVIEWIMLAAIFLTFLSIIIPTIREYRHNRRIEAAIGDIIQIEDAILLYRQRFNRLPPNLEILQLGNLSDPWGNPYQYALTNLQSDNPVNPPRRTAQYRLPLNDDYDLFSKGSDGVTSSSLLDPPGRDDIVRANNGTFIGLAGEY